MKVSKLFIYFGMVFSLFSSVLAETFTKDGITINTDYEGANMKFVSIEGNTLTFEPDLKGGRNWFYWSFEISSTKTRDLTFVVQTKQKYTVKVKAYDMLGNLAEETIEFYVGRDED